MEIEQPVMRMDGFQKELHPEAFATQMLDFPLVRLIDALHNQFYQ